MALHDGKFELAHQVLDRESMDELLQKHISRLQQQLDSWAARQERSLEGQRQELKALLASVRPATIEVPSGAVPAPTPALAPVLGQKRLAVPGPGPRGAVAWQRAVSPNGESRSRAEKSPMPSPTASRGPSPASSCEALTVQPLKVADNGNGRHEKQAHSMAQPPRKTPAEETQPERPEEPPDPGAEGPRRTSLKISPMPEVRRSSVLGLPMGFPADAVAFQPKSSAAESDVSAAAPPVRIPQRLSWFWCYWALRRAIQLVVDTPEFDLACGAVILANTVLIGVETDVIARTSESTDDIRLAQMIMNFWYITELFLRIFCDGISFHAADRTKLFYNMFDLCLVALSMADLIADSGGIRGLMLGRLLRVVRLVRIVRAFRVIHLVRHLGEFRRLIFLLAGTGQTLLWCGILVFGIMYVFAIWFCQGVAQHIEDHPHEETVIALEDHYGSLPRTLLSLFMAISDGIHWHALMEPLLDTHWALAALFLTYVSLSHFAILHIVAAVFVDSAMQSTQKYRELMVEEKSRQRELYIKHMRTLFDQIDTDASGHISLQELEDFLREEDLSLQSYFEALDINASEANVLFRLLDADGSGRIDIQEFCAGCMRLKGAANSFDIQCMIHENRRVAERQADFVHFVEDRFDQVERSLGALQVNGRAPASLPKPGVPPSTRPALLVSSPWDVSEKKGG